MPMIKASGWSIPNVAGQLAPVHAWQVNVDNHQIKSPTLEDLQRFFRRFTGNNVILSK